MYNLLKHPAQTSPASAFAGALAAAPLAWAKHLLAQVRAELEIMRAMDALKAMSDRELHDIGLHRDQIGRAVRTDR